MLEVLPELDWPEGVPDDAVAVLLVDVGPDGTVTAARVLRATHGRLADVALARIDEVRFAPARRDGVAVAGVATWTLTRDLLADDAIEVVDRTPWRARPAAPRVEAGPAGTWRMSGGDVERVAGGAGDLAHALQSLPGVAAFDLRSTALSVRGADPSDTVWVVDGVPYQGPRSAGTYLSRIPTLLVDEVVVHGAAQPAELPGSGGGIVALTLQDPDDTELDGVVEVNTGLIQGQVSMPLGRPGAGNAVQLTVRRSILEPGIAALNQVGLLEGWLVRVEDLALRVRLRPHARHELRVTALGGRTRVRRTDEAEGAQVVSTDDTSSVLGVVRHDWQPRAGFSFSQQLSWTREAQDVSTSDEGGEYRGDVRHRVAWRGAVEVDLGDGNSVHAGAMAGLFDLRGWGNFADPRAAPPGVRGPWRRWAPRPNLFEAGDNWVEAAAWVEQRVTRGRIDARLGLRATQRGTANPLLSPRASVGVRVGQATRVQAWGGLLQQTPRDPLDFERQRGIQPLQETRTAQLAVTAQQGLGEHLLLRLDLWSRWQSAVAVWPDDPARVQGSPTEAVGSATGRGADLSLAARWSRARGMVSASVADGRLTNPLATVGPERVEPWWVVPWSATAQGGVRLGRRQPWDLGARVRVRAGASQVPFEWEAVDGVLRVRPVLDQRTSLAPTWQAAIRAERSGVVAGRVELSAYADVIATGGPLAQGLRGGSVDPDTGDVVPPEVVVVRDLPLVPWLGLRARW